MAFGFCFAQCSLVTPPCLSLLCIYTHSRCPSSPIVLCFWPPSVLAHDAYLSANPTPNYHYHFGQNPGDPRRLAFFLRCGGEGDRKSGCFSPSSPLIRPRNEPFFRPPPLLSPLSPPLLLLLLVVTALRLLFPSPPSAPKSEAAGVVHAPDGGGCAACGGARGARGREARGGCEAMRKGRWEWVWGNGGGGSGGSCCCW